MIFLIVTHHYISVGLIKSLLIIQKKNKIIRKRKILCLYTIINYISLYILGHCMKHLIT